MGAVLDVLRIDAEIAKLRGATGKPDQTIEAQIIKLTKTKERLLSDLRRKARSNVK